MNFIYTINPDSKCPIMLVNKSIGEDGVIGSQFQEEVFLLAEMGVEDITIYINSLGGSVIDGMSIYSAIKDCKVPVKTVNVGVAASIASVLFLSGSHRVMYDYSVLMVHNPFNSNGTEDSSLDIIRESIITMISEKSTLTPEQVGEMMNNTTWITAEQAYSYGLCDEIKKSGKPAKQNTQDIHAKWESSNLFLNKIILKNNKQEMIELIKILNEGGLNVSNEASETEIYDVVKSLINKHNKEDENVEDGDSEDAGEDVQNSEMKEMENKYNSLKDAYDSLVNEMSEKKKMEEAKMAEEVENKITNLINSALTSGKIKQSSVEMCKNMAKTDIASFENFLADLPVNKTAAKIEAVAFENKIVDDRFSGYKPAVASEIMNAVNAKLK